MKKKSYLAGLLVVSLGGAEVIEYEQPHLIALKEPSVESGVSFSLAGNPHIHCGIDTEVYATTASPFFASGARHAEETFRLHAIPQQDGGVRLVAFPALNLWVTSPSEIQNMYGFCEKGEVLTQLLAARLGLPQSQLEAIRRTVREGRELEVGGYTASRVFRRSELEYLGMNFRPPEV